MSERNTYWTSVLKRILILVLIILGIIVSLKLAVFYMPFLLAFIISLMIEPLIRWLMKHLKITRKFSSILVFILVFGTIIGLLIWGIVTIVSESTNLLSGFNGYYEKIYNGIQDLIKSVDFEKLNISNEIFQMFQDTALSFVQKISVYLQNFLTGLIKWLTSIPSMAIYFAVFFLSLFFICTDKIYMLDEFEHHFPEKWVKEISTHLRAITKSLGGYLKAQATLILISFVISVIGLFIMQCIGLNVGFPLLIALGIGFVDALPILGSGSVMIPWAVISSLNGDIHLGIGVVVLWIIMSITRQFLEPRIVSGNIGVHPIFTVVAMYTGFRLIGVMGMFVGPIILIILKNVFSDFIDTGVMKAIFGD